MKLSSLPVFTLLATWACAVGAVVVPGASTPVFYLVSTTGSSSSNLLPLHINGGTGNVAALTGTGGIGKMYFTQGSFVAEDPAGTSNVYKAYIAASPSGGGCTAFGPLTFVQGSTTDKCGMFNGFGIQSDTENSQLGARLVFNFVGGFYACGSTQDIWYKTSADQGPSGCNAVDLYTVPVEV